MRTILHICAKEFRQVFRDRTMIGLIFFTPIVQMIFMGFAVSNDVRRLPLAIVDFDHSARSRAFVQRLGSTDYFKLRDRAVTLREAERLLDRGDVAMAVVVPRGFDRDLTRRQLRRRLVLAADGKGEHRHEHEERAHEDHRIERTSRRVQSQPASMSARGSSLPLRATSPRHRRPACG